MREPVTIQPRKTFAAKRRLQVLCAQNGRCTLCDQKIIGPFDVDHRVPLALGGTNETDNLEALHPECHDAKTSGDITRIAKAKRQNAKAFEPRKPSRLQSRGFNKSLTKGFDGIVRKVVALAAEGR